MPQLDPQFFISQVFWLVLVFTAIYAFVSQWFFPKIQKAVLGRENKIKEDVEDSDKFLTEHKKIQNDIIQIISQARHEGFIISTEAIRKAEREVNEKIGAAEKDIVKKMALEEEKLARVYSQMSEELTIISEQLKDEILNNLLHSINKNTVN